MHHQRLLGVATVRIQTLIYYSYVVVQNPCKSHWVKLGDRRKLLVDAKNNTAQYNMSSWHASVIVTMRIVTNQSVVIVD